MPTRRNFCPNPALKNNVYGWYSPNGTGIRQAVTGFDRPYAFRLNVAANNGNYVAQIGQTSSISPGQTWTASCSVRCSINQSVTVSATWLDEDYQIFSQDSSTVALSANVVTRVSKTSVAPSSVFVEYLEIRIEFIAGASSSTLDASMALMEQVAANDTYFDGDSPGASWDGANGDSSSTLNTGGNTNGNFFAFFE